MERGEYALFCGYIHEDLTLLADKRATCAVRQGRNVIDVIFPAERSDDAMKEYVKAQNQKTADEPIAVFFNKVLVGFDAQNMCKVLHVQKNSSLFRFVYNHMGFMH